MVEEVLEDVHHVGGHVVEGDGRVAATGRAVGLGEGEAEARRSIHERDLVDYNNGAKKGFFMLFLPIFSVL